MKRTWTCGSIKVSVEHPDEMVLSGLTLSVDSESRQDFIQNAEHLGGLAGLSMSSSALGYRQTASVYGDAETGALRLLVMLYEPPRRPGQEAPFSHPFFGPLAAQVARDANVPA